MPAELPLACTLGPGDGAERMRRWQRLAAAGSPAAALTAGRLEVRYEPRPGVLAELRDLARAEAECCAFAHWAVSAPGGVPTLLVRAGPGAAGQLAAIAALFGAAGHTESRPRRGRPQRGVRID